MKIDVELIALDLKTCTRCVGTLSKIEQALRIVQPVLNELEIQARLSQIIVKTEEEATRQRLVTSPTVRINGQDIANETFENECSSCSDLCGCEEGTTCRLWHYRGTEFTEAPVGLIVEAILQRALSNWKVSNQNATESVYAGLPENLKRFFAGKRRKSGQLETTCCSQSEAQSCCARSEKADCCDKSNPSLCACQ